MNRTKTSYQSFKRRTPSGQLTASLWINTRFLITRYLMSNAHGRWNGAEKAEVHMELCGIFAETLCDVPSNYYQTDVLSKPYKLIHEKTQELTGYLDTAIGFPLDSDPDYDDLAPKFFKKFYALSRKALKKEA